MNEEMEKAVGRWFINRMVEKNSSSCGASLVSFELDSNTYVNLLISHDNKISGYTIYNKED